jgi:hypothetical protein
LTGRKRLWQEKGAESSTDRVNQTTDLAPEELLKGRQTDFQAIPEFCFALLVGDLCVAARSGKGTARS